MTVLSRQECSRLLAQIDVGRVAVSVRALPAVVVTGIATATGTRTLRSG